MEPIDESCNRNSNRQLFPSGARTEPPPMISPIPAITDLHIQWHILLDLDRAEAVSTIHQAGVSLRSLAKALNCSDGLLRHLLHALQASPEDLALARLGNISTWELARRSVANRKGLGLTPPEASASEIEESSIRWHNTVRNWFREQSLSDPYALQVAKEAHCLLLNAEQAGRLPRGRVPSCLPTNEIIRRWHPADQMPRNADFVSWFGRWLAIWSYNAIPDSCVRKRVFQLLTENGPVTH